MRTSRCNRSGQPGVLLDVTDTDPRSDTSREQADAVVTRIADDLDAGFVDLVHAYEKVVYSVALRVSGPHDAEDLAAESFLRAYRALLSFDRERIRALNPRPWLLTIVLNTWRNTLRESARRPRQVPLSEAPEKPGTEPSLDDTVQRAETQRDLAELVGELPHSQRVAVVLRHVVGFTIAEVAATMGCPEGTAKSHVSRGLLKLRTLCDARQFSGVAGTAPALRESHPAATPRRRPAGRGAPAHDGTPAFTSRSKR